MTDVVIQTVLFFLLVSEGMLTRLAYALVLSLQNKIGSKIFSGVSDVFTAVIGAGCMLLTCLILADSVRVFYAVFYIGGIALMHLLLMKSSRKERRRLEKIDRKERKELCATVDNGGEVVEQVMTEFGK